MASVAKPGVRSVMVAWPPCGFQIGCGVSNHRGASRQRAAVAVIRNHPPQIFDLRGNMFSPALAGTDQSRVDSFARVAVIGLEERWINVRQAPAMRLKFL